VEDRINRLRRTLLFRALSDEDIRRVAELLRERSDHRRSTVYRQGELDTTFYIIVSGRLRVRLRDEKGEERILNYLEAGDSFGERSLLTGEKRDVTVDVEEDAVLLYLEKRDFDRLLNRYLHLHEALGLQKLEKLRNVPLFEKLPIGDIQRIAGLIGRTRYRRGTVICSQDELGTTFYIIESGRVEVRAKDETGVERVITHLQDGDFFGERSLLTGEPRDNTVQALEDTSLFYLNKGDFDRLQREYPSFGEALNIEAEMRELMLTQSLPWQREDEVLVALSYRHIYAFLRRLWLPILLLLASIGILVLAFTMGWTRIYTYALYAFLAMCVAIAGIAALLVVWFLFDWKNDYFAVTNKRVVHVEKVILIRESRDEAPLERIQDIFILTPGILANLLRFNDLSIQTAGAGGSIVFRTLRNAAWVRDRIFEQVERIKAEERAEEREAIRHKLELELGQVEQEILPTPAPEEAPLVTEPELSPVTERERMPPSELLQGCLGYLVPKERLEENGVVTWRKHWFILIYKIVIPTLLSVILLQLALATLMYPSYLSYLSDYQFHCCGALLFGLLLSLFFLWYRYEDWRNDIYQLTDDRIIDIARLPLGLREERREASLDVIQDIRYVIPGVVANLLDYGSVVITTAGREAVFTFDWVHHPRLVQEEIFARMEAFRERERQQERGRRAIELLDWFATYTDLTEEQKGSDEQDKE
jgi:CRP-like cAMP-binding protein/uncharacterized membrane protein YdbT with pleckstrin-like domain